MKLLNISEMLDAASQTDMSNATEYRRQAEALATEIAADLANHLGVCLVRVGYMGPEFGGLLATFCPLKSGDECPQALGKHDPDGDWHVADDNHK